MDKNIFEHFLEGRDDQKYIVSVESSYDNNYVHLIIHDPVDGKRIEKHRFRPFLWMKEIDYRRFYKGNRNEIRKKMVQYNISFKELTHTDSDGDVVDRLKNGYRYIVHTSQSYSKLLDFFKYGGLSPNDNRDLFLTIGTTEQFLIQTGKRLFKGMEDYDEVHRLTFDIETTGLYPENSYIFEIGVKDNRGFEEVIKIKDETEEIKGIKRFFDIIDELKPAIICGYNSENFDWDFIFKRTKIHEERIESIASTLKYDSEIKRKKATLKMGAEMEYYEQTVMWGYNIMDIWHAVRRAAAINSNIKETGLKYITKFEKMAKPNRIYIAHQNISELWNSKEEYILNNENGKYEKYNGTQLTENENIVTGEYIVTRYLLDDLWETEQIDYIYNQATFLLSKIVPSTLQRTSTMGTAALWKTLMLGWSYENDLAIPSYQPKQKFTGGLSRLLKVGYSKNVVKFDYGSLYPSIQLTHNVFPDVDVSEALKGFLKYIFDSRAFYKKKMKEAKKKGDDKKAKLFDRKQLPLKILNNSNFGSVSAPDVYPWGDINVGEMITCTGRQYLRLMITFFMGKGYEPIVGDSVTYDTPIYLLNDQTKEIDIIPICDLFNESSEFLDKEKLRDYEKKNYSVLTVNGWKNINYVYRHETDKTIHRVSTKDRLVCVTEDHSLFRDGKMIKPSELNRGEKIDVYELPIYDNINDIENEDLYWLYGFFLGDGSAIYGSRKQYYKSKKTGKTNINKGIRGEWKISNKDINLLNKLKDIIIKNYPELKLDIKNHMNSSGVYNLVIYNTNFSKKFAEDFYTSYREKKIPSFILNTSIKNKTAFINGVCASDGYGTNIEDTSDIGMKSQIAMAGIGYLLKGLGIEYKIKLRKDKQNFINFSLKNRNRNNSNFTDKTKRKTDEVWNNEIINNKNKFVYDISTEDGTFIGGIGAINLKNTDGFNFIIPDDIDSHVYITKGTHKNYKKGETISGVAGDIAEFNETYMRGVMELNIDEFCESSINIARKNYANLIDGEVKIVGNTLKSNKLPVYIEEFLDVGIRHLLNGNGKEFLNLYYDYIDKIFSKEISLIKIASKSKVKQTIEDYKKRCNEKNINGNPLPKQAHMELLIKENVKVNLGDIVYYVNTGTKKSHGDVQTKKNKETGDNELIFNCTLITKDTIDSIDAKTINYNISKYIDAFNKRIEPLLVCFSPDIRDSILISNPEDRPYFTDKQMELVAGEPMDPEDQDNLEEDVMKMEDSELSFWERNDIDPNYMIKKKVSV